VPVVLDSIENDLDAQIQRYGQGGTVYKTFHHSLKVIQLILTAAIPLVALFSSKELSPGITAGLGAVILVLEGVHSLVRPDEVWLTYRTAQMALLSERRLFCARRGPYAETTDAGGVLAERVDMIVSSEYNRFRAIQEQAAAERKDPKALGKVTGQ
jgi:hypothetical protein